MTVAATTPGVGRRERGRLTEMLLAAADVGRAADQATGSSAAEAGDIAAWFRAAAEQAGRAADGSVGYVHGRSREKGVPIFG